ncbi:3-isopropylmalate dehydratase small subunit [Rhizorhabdus histidinilytica]|uniref:3-isopropylmalate dehydratase small subunit n=1 Tax=Rhizorhabdus histidinilytica TaxID=439228 RepID=A0A1T5GUV4_9SPHN|nr:3-isopropylmalate dehydratase small subunit [Rhizorhabdus histidinilytica]SKC12100.1 3-isopropylmalate/(R)-2-methylmalate dehydratase small subunit [Rhizorhabdus histidinilytica]
MAGFTSITAPAAPLPLANVDTDKILAGEHLKTISRSGLGAKLFSGLRYDEQGAERPDFILNRDPWRRAGILIALDNFGSGSSREHAPWALRDFGITCVIAPSFADIFHNNCFKNFILPIVLDRALVDQLLDDAADPSRCRMRVDLPTQTIARANGEIVDFEIDAQQKDALLNGIDEIGGSLAFLPQIERWERASQLIAPDIPLDVPSS